MLLLRSLAFNAAFVLNNALWFIVCLPTLLMPPRAFMLHVARPWARSNLWLHRVICQVSVEIRGRAHKPAGGFLVASKHQSAWETLALFVEFDAPSYILKRELMAIPFFGWYLKRTGQVPIDRGDRTQAMQAMNQAARTAIAAGRQLIIFPEGTRRPVDAPPNYKQGVAHIYATSGATCLPVAINAGVLWPRRSFLKHPGTIVMEFLPPIAPGVPREEFLPLLQDVIETATNRLVAEARSGIRTAAPAPASPAE
jgi:1-acyl-sn-glycerol-3-phosphate acyltransferase